jgi:hypothetical protein
VSRPGGLGTADEASSVKPLEQQAMGSAYCA